LQVEYLRRYFNMGKNEVYAKLKDAIVNLDSDAAEAASKEAVKLGLNPVDCIGEGLSAGMQVISDLFDDGKAFVPELMLAAEAFEKSVKILTASMPAGSAGTSAGKVLLHTVEGDVHDIGKNIVRTILSANNFEVIDLGRNAPVRTVIEKAQELSVDIIAGSALMSTTMPRQREEVALLKEKGLRDKYICIYGGAPVTQKWCDSIGADGYSDSATDTPIIAKKLLAQKKGK
jgi:trimethylamine corrinoid protein